MSRRKFIPVPIDSKYNEKVPKTTAEKLSFGVPISAEPDYEPPSTPLYAISWGLNANGRAGNKAAAQIDIPRQVQLSHRKKYISCAAGKHHSVLVTDEGIMYSFGDGRKGQLGFGENLNPLRRSGITQSLPRQVQPSGVLKFGRDLKITEVTAGSNFTIGRELSTEEGVDLLRGLRRMEDHLKQLLGLYPDSDKLRWAWAVVRQERYTMSRVSEGQLVSWGTGKYGELGVGPFNTKLTSPHLIAKLKNVCIIQVAAGANHVLALSKDSVLYSWGRGSSGQLGHKDFENRHNPDIVKFFDPYYVEYCAAGDRHSAVLITTKKGLPRSEQLRRVSTFGRGNHGRLGNNKVFSTATPVVVEIFPPSTRQFFFRQVKCGGAHTLLLGENTVEKCLANPWGKQTCVLAWGYGTNGQLGHGDLVDSYIPVKSRIPKWEIIAEISAGRSWSMARTIGGELYTWGKGWRGQLGHGKNVKFSIVPRKVDTFASFLHLSSNFSHNVGISVPKKFLNAKSSEKAASQSDIFKPLYNTSLQSKENKSQYIIDCCRRLNAGLRNSSNVRYICKTCNLSSVCFDCVKLCHRGHNVHVRSLRKDVTDAEKLNQEEAERIKKITKVNLSWFESLKSIKTLRFTTSAAQVRRVTAMAKSKKVKKKKKKSKHKFSDMLYQTKAWSKAKKANKGKFRNDDSDEENEHEHMYLSRQPICRCGIFNSKCRQLPVIQEATAEEPDDHYRKLDEAAIKIQKCARYYMGCKQIQNMKRYIKDLRYDSSKIHFLTKIMKPIWTRFDRALENHKEIIELNLMSIEDDVKRKFDYYYGLQIGLGSMDAMLFGVRLLYGRASTQLPRIRMWSGQISEEIRSSFVFSTVSMREKQLELHFSRRHPISDLTLLMRNVPRVNRTEGQFYDSDVCLFTQKFNEERKMNIWRKKYYAHVNSERERLEKEKEKARAEHLAIVNDRKNVIAKSKAIKQNPGPPPGKPPLAVVLLMKERQKEEERLKILEDIRKQEELEDTPFNMFEKKEFVPIRRRHSIGDPADIYSRLKDMRSNILLSGYAKRRNSLPSKIEFLRANYVTRYNYTAGIQNSLSLYKQRHASLYEYLDPEMDKIWEQNMDLKRKGLRRIMKLNWLNPRLPSELLQLITDSDRRRTVAEPERLSKQIFVMVEMRNCFSKLRVRARRADKIVYRRRSFDMGEAKDASLSVNETLGYEFEEKWKLATMQELYHAQGIISSNMIVRGLIEQSDEMSISQVSLSTLGFESVEELKDQSTTRPKSKGIPKITGRGNYNSTSYDQTLYSASYNPNIWQEHYTEQGATYYYNPSTGSSSWEYPAGEDVELCSQHQDDSGNWYWYNNTTGETSWV